MNDELLYYDDLSGLVKGIPIEKYPDGAPLINFVRSPRKVTRVLMRPKSMDAFVASMFWVDALTERGHPVPELILPLVPGSRQDRLNDKGDYLFTLKSIARMINARNFPSVTVLDPHSDATSALIDRCKVIHSASLNIAGTREYDYVIAPDGGAEKRAGVIARMLEVPLLHAWKVRDVTTGKLSDFGMESALIGNKRVLFVDDLCDGGGTFLGLAKKIGAPDLVYADLYISHGLFTQGIDKLNDVFDKITTTDSVIREDDKNLIIIPVCEALLKGQ